MSQTFHCQVYQTFKLDLEFVMEWCYLPTFTSERVPLNSQPGLFVIVLDVQYMVSFTIVPGLVLV